MAIGESEIERIISTMQTNCAVSGGCSVYDNGGGSYLSCVMGDKEICFIDQEEGRDPNMIRSKIQEGLGY